MTPPILGIWASQISGHLWAPAGAYDALATVTVPSGGVSSITFAGIPTGYKHLQIRGIGRSDYSGASTNLFYKLNNDSTTSNYTYHILRGDGSGSATAASGTSLNLLGNDIIVANTGTANAFGTIVCDILDYANTSKYKTQRALGGNDRNGSGQVALDSSLWINTSAITQIELYPQNGSWMQYSSFALYGIR